MKRFTLLISLLIMAGFTQAQIISQYIETNSGTSPKGIEIWNNTDSDIPAQSDGTIVYYVIEATDDESETTISTEQSYSVQGTLSMPFTEDFTTGSYTVTLGGEGSDGSSDYFFITNNTNISPSYTGATSNFFAGQDLDDGGWTGSASPSQLTWSNIDASGVSNLTFSCDFASEGGGIDAADSLLFEYRVDGGSWNNLIAFENKGGSNTNFWEDTDFDGTGDGTQLTSSFSTFTKDFTISGSTVDICFTADLSSEGEEFAIDNVSLSENAVSDEPTNHVLTFAAAANGHDQIDLTWNDNDGDQAADGFLIKASTTSFDAINDPTDTNEESDDTNLSDGSGVVNVVNGGTANESYSWTGLDESTTYYFKIYPYTNSGSNIDYKTDGTIPSANATTEAAPIVPDLIISEVADPGDNYDGRFVELYNVGDTTIDFSTTTVYFDRQANGGNHSSIQLTGSIATNETYVIGNSSNIDSIYGFEADLNFGNVTGNGDDGYFLYFNGDETKGTLIDAYGVIDVDGSEEEWEYEDSKAVRKNSVTSPSDTWTVSEWNIISNCNTTSMTPSMHPVTTWNGISTKSNDWSIEGNWDNGLPGNGISVFIPSGLSTYPTISSSSTIEDIKLANSATLVGHEKLTVNGTTTIEKSFNGYTSTEASDGWYAVSSPIDGMAVTGSDFEPGANDDLYEYDEENNMWLNYTGGTFDDNNFVAGKGYLVSYENDITNSFVSATGFNTTDGIYAPISETNTKWNLVGNPYPSKLTYANVDATNISSPKTINESTGSWDDLGAEVEVGEGFFVFAEEGSSSITFNLDDQTHGSSKKVTQNYAYLRANFDSLSVFARFGTDASASKNYEWKYDARYMYPATSIPYLSTITDDEVMASTYVFNDETESVVVPLYFSVSEEREISFSTDGNIGYTMAIEDKLDGNITEIDADNPFEFTALPTDDEHRFNLHLTKSSTIGVEENSELAGVNVYAHDQNIYFNADENLTNGTMTIYNTIGQVVMTSNVETGSEIIRMENRGAYIVKVQSNEGSLTEKVIIQ